MRSWPMTSGTPARRSSSLAGLTKLVLPEPELPSATERMLVRRFDGVAKARPITAPSTGSATASAPASVAVAEASSM